MPPRAGGGGGPPEEGYIVKRVLFGTNRSPTGDLDANAFYGAERGNLQVGSCYVSIPYEHEAGELESPNWLRLEFREDPTKHVVLLAVRPETPADFIALLRKETGKSAKKRAFVFIHGYNTKFKDAARRTAQLAHDLQFAGAPIFFSWPSRGELASYFEDRDDAEWAQTDLGEFLMFVARESQAEEIYTIAHSMGNLVTASVLAEVNAALEPEHRARFKSVILAAPDIDAGVFKREIAPKLAAAGLPVTVYTSREDKALQAAQKVWNNLRLGQNAAELAGIPGIEAVDSTTAATDYLHHEYFGEHGALLRDMNLVFKGIAPGEGERDYLSRKVVGQGKGFWEFGDAEQPE